MAGEVSKQDQSLTRGAQMVASAKSELTSELTKLESKLQQLNTAWQGAGGAGFASAMIRWQEDSRKITSALDGFETNLRGSEQTYNATDEQSAAAINRVAAQLG